MEDSKYQAGSPNPPIFLLFPVECQSSAGACLFIQPVAGSPCHGSATGLKAGHWAVSKMEPALPHDTFFLGERHRQAYRAVVSV